MSAFSNLHNTQNISSATGTVTEVDTGTGLTGGPITTTGTVSLDTKLAPLDTLTGNSLKVPRVNAGETALEYVTPAAGTVTSVSGTTNRITSTGGATPVIDISASYVGQASITTVGTLSSGAVPASLVTAGTLGTGSYVIDTRLTVPQEINTANAITATSNAATIPVTQKHNIVTNSSAATLTITLTTTSAVSMQTVIVQILDFSAVAQTITWVNTENSTITAPVTSNASTSLPLTVGFIYNSSTAKWRCIASA